MPGYSIHLPPRVAASDSEAERFRLVREGFAVAAVLFWPVWFLAKRLWLGAAGVYGLWLATALAVALLGLPAPAAAAIWALVLLLIGLEARSVERWTLRRRGWQEAGVAIADNLQEAEMRVAVALAGPDAVIPLGNVAATAVPPTGASRRPEGQPAVLGLFPEPQR